ncbi:hypothetical protein BDQ17DRAFT_1544301 [Cyathus striatus]|nr:hypothetical protein BDQ17DRAFT_1544301 [Cyathus striatus]
MTGIPRTFGEEVSYSPAEVGCYSPWADGYADAYAKGDRQWHSPSPDSRDCTVERGPTRLLGQRYFNRHNPKDDKEQKRQARSSGNGQDLWSRDTQDRDEGSASQLSIPTSEIEQSEGLQSTLDDESDWLDSPKDRNLEKQADSNRRTALHSICPASDQA